MIYELTPRGYNTPSIFSSLSDIKSLPDKTVVTVFGYIDSFEKKQTKMKKLSTIKAKLYKDGESINLQWTTSSQKAEKMKFGLSMKAPKDKLIQVTGKVNSYQINDFVYKFIEQPILN